MKTKSVFSVPFGVAFLLFLLFVQQAIGKQSVEAQAATPSLTVTTISTTPTPFPTASAVTNEQLLAVYKEVLESTTRAVDNVHSTANIVLTIVGIVFTGLGIIGLGGAWFVGKTAEKAENALRQATQATELVAASEGKTQDLEKVHEELARGFGKAQSELAKLSSDLDWWKNSVDRDRAAIKRSLEMIQIDEHGMSVFGDDAERKWKSKMALIEMSRRDDSVVRRHCVKILGALVP